MIDFSIHIPHPNILHASASGLPFCLHSALAVFDSDHVHLSPSSRQQAAHDMVGMATRYLRGTCRLQRCKDSCNLAALLQVVQRLQGSTAAWGCCYLANARWMIGGSVGCRGSR